MEEMSNLIVPLFIIAMIVMVGGGSALGDVLKKRGVPKVFGFLISFGVPLTCLILWGVSGGERREAAAGAREAQLAPFRNNLALYHQLSASANPTPEARINGKLLVVERKRLTVEFPGGSARVKWLNDSAFVPDVSPLTLELPTELRPSTPQEVRTVAFLDSSAVRAGSYNRGGGDAYRQIVEIVILDLNSKRVCRLEPLEGSLSQFSQSVGNLGKVKDSAILEILVNLPRI
jgi:hypothetical protein